MKAEDEERRHIHRWQFHIPILSVELPEGKAAEIVSCILIASQKPIQTILLYIVQQLVQESHLLFDSLCNIAALEPNKQNAMQLKML